VQQEVIMQAKQSMFDTIGVTQHHDAITGTGKQAVADDYSLRVSTTFNLNSRVYSDIISEAAANIAGIESTGPWEWCFKSNSSYLDCPIASQPAHKTKLLVAVHNPSLIPIEHIKLAVPHANYSVHVFNPFTSTFEETE
jgi:hypothetical protein